MRLVGSATNIPPHFVLLNLVVSAGSLAFFKRLLYNFEMPFCRTLWLFLEALFQDQQSFVEALFQDQQLLWKPFFRTNLFWKPFAHFLSLFLFLLWAMCYAVSSPPSLWVELVAPSHPSGLVAALGLALGLRYLSSSSWFFLVVGLPGSAPDRAIPNTAEKCVVKILFCQIIAMAYSIILFLTRRKNKANA